MSARSQVSLTGITTTGTPHLGNYAGAIRPAIAASRHDNVSSFYFLADYHSLAKTHDVAALSRSTLEIAATWLALGLDPERVTFYRQSDIPEIPELTWILSGVTAKGLMNRAHAYKGAVADNEAAGSRDPDKGITMALYGYPLLMAADILMFRATHVPVGRDQKQHLEMARDIALRFNHVYGDVLTVPEPVIDDHTATLAGLDGRKMSKSYNNTIPLFAPAKKLRKLIMKIRTNSLEPGEPKDPEGCSLFSIYRAFATPGEVEVLRQAYAEGIGWGEVKERLFQYLDAILAEPRETYEALMADPARIETRLQDGAEKARAVSREVLAEVRHAIGIRPLTG